MQCVLLKLQTIVLTYLEIENHCMCVAVDDKNVFLEVRMIFSWREYIPATTKQRERHRNAGVSGPLSLPFLRQWLHRHRASV